VTMTHNRPAPLAATTARRRDERSRVPTCGETEVAIVAGLDPARNLTQDCADYYLLTHLRMPHYLPGAAGRLEDLASELADEFTIYLDLACGGELRHASTWPYELPSCPVLGRGNDRSVAWKDWLAWETPVYRMEYAVQAFEEASWPSRNYGGEPWMLIASTVLSFLRGEMSAESFIDRVWNLEHHGGVCLNKVYATEELAVVLEAHGKDDYETLLSYSSGTTKLLWDKAFDKKSFGEACASLVLWTRLRGLVPVAACAAESH
jgi:hypothetical protein